MENVSSRCGKSDNAPRLRFPEFSGEWIEKKLGEIFKKNTEKNTELKITNVICNSAKNGLIPQREYFDKDIANSENINGYYIIQKYDFVYNPRKSTEAPYGPVSVYKYPDKGIVSPLYLCFRATEEINSDFYEFYFKSSSWHRYIYLSGDNGARHDRVSMRDDVFFAMPVNIPSLPEQKKIAAFFTLLDRRIQKQRQLVEFLKTYKRGVLQSVFSKNYKWEELSIEDIFSCIIDKNHPDKTVLTIVQGTGTLPRNSIDRKISYNAESVSSYKKVKKNDFILHLRSFEGGLEIANEEGIVSPAYTILRATKNISPLFYYNYFRSYNFINEKLRIAVEGIRDGKSINMNTFWKIKVPFPHYELQNYYASFFSLIDKNIKKNESLLQALEKGKRQLLQKMFI